MRHRMSARGLVLLLTATAFLVHVPSSTAAPLTIDLRMHLTDVCAYTTSSLPDCARADEYVPFSVTYDPDTLVLHDLGYAWWFEFELLDFDTPFATLPNPWGGAPTPYRYGVAYFSNNGPGYLEYRDIDVTMSESFHADSCADGLDCNWRTSFSLHNSTAGTPPFGGPPTAADVERLFHRGNIEFYSAAFYVDPADGDRVSVPGPGSRLYLGRVPEPGVSLLLTAGLIAALRRRLVV